MKKDNINRQREDRSLSFIRDVSDFMVYTSKQLLDHLQVVADGSCVDASGRMELPKVHFAKLIDQVNRSERDQLYEFRGFSDLFDSDVQLISGTGRSSHFAGRDRQEKKEISSLPRRRYQLMPQIKFMDVRMKGEKILFILDASEVMFDERLGGEAALTALQENMFGTLTNLPDSVRFNVLLYNKGTVASFVPEMTPITSDSLQIFRAWLDPLLDRSAAAGGLPADANTYQPASEYKTIVGNDAQNWLLAMQAALEQTPDTILLIGSDWGQHGMGPEKGRRLNDFTLWMKLGGHGPQSINKSPSTLGDRRMRANFVLYSQNEVVSEGDLRRFKDEPAPYPRELTDYLQYVDEQIVEHLHEVCYQHYMPVEQGPPLVHWFRLATEKGRKSYDPVNRKVRKMTNKFDGTLELFSAEQFLEPDEEGPLLAEEEPVESDFRFFGTEVEGSRIAFVLDVSDAMFDEEADLTNAFLFIEGQIAEMVSELEPGTDFNLFAYHDKRVISFTPEMQSELDPVVVDAWLASLPQRLIPAEPSEEDVDGSDEPEDASVDRAETDGEFDSKIYEDTLGEDIQGLPLAIQRAMEQQADSILVAGTGFGRLPVSPERARRLLDFAVLRVGGTRESSISVEDVDEDTETEEDEEGNLIETVIDDDPDENNVLATGWDSDMDSALQVDTRQVNTMIDNAVDAFVEENIERKEQGLPSGFVPNFLDYVEYTPDHIVNHLLTVCRDAYPVEGDTVALPVIHFAQLVERKSRAVRRDLRQVEALSEKFKGEVIALLSAPTEDEMFSLNRELDLYKAPGDETEDAAGNGTNAVPVEAAAGAGIAVPEETNAVPTPAETDLLSAQ